MTFSIYSKAELIEKLEAAQRMIQAQERSNIELQRVISMHNWDRKMAEDTIAELVEQRNQLHECVKAHLALPLTP